jgi:rSAM/selenodomain-associated transferase 2
VAEPRISIIIPVLNEAGTIAGTLASLQGWRRQGDEIIVVDGGSQDATVQLARPLADGVYQAGPGRAVQMQHGASRAHGLVLWFLHADTLPAADAITSIRMAVRSGLRWGYFRVRFPEPSPLLGLIAALMNARSRISRIATGDQGIFVTRALFEQINGFPPLALMEDIALTRELKRHAPPACLASTVTTSARRWRRHGTLRTILLMWSLRLAYFCGVSPQTLVKYYRIHGS